MSLTSTGMFTQSVTTDQLEGAMERFEHFTKPGEYREFIVDCSILDEYSLRELASLLDLPYEELCKAQDAYLLLTA